MKQSASFKQKKGCGFLKYVIQPDVLILLC